MNDMHLIEEFLSEIKETFPEVAVFIDNSRRETGFTEEDKMFTCDMEAFSQATTNEIGKLNIETAASHLNYMSKKLKNAEPIIHEYIDIYYVELLMWDIDDKKIFRQGWELIPQNLKELYIAMWGKPDL